MPSHAVDLLSVKAGKAKIAELSVAPQKLPSNEGVSIKAAADAAEMLIDRAIAADLKRLVDHVTVARSVSGRLREKLTAPPLEACRKKQGSASWGTPCNRCRFDRRPCLRPAKP
jgi:hypothetical protein